MISDSFMDGIPFTILKDHLRLLTDEERAGLALEGFGIDQAEMVEFETTEDFKERQNNFYITFAGSPKSRLIVEIYRGRLAFQRFATLYPDHLEELDVKFRSTDYHDFTAQDWEELHNAYKTISKLVDKADLDVAKDGRVDGWYLCR